MDSGAEAAAAADQTNESTAAAAASDVASPAEASQQHEQAMEVLEAVTTDLTRASSLEAGPASTSAADHADSNLTTNETTLAASASCVVAPPAPPVVPVKTAVLLLSIGYPASDKLEDIQRFSSALFEDRDIIQMPMQGFLAPILSRRGAPRLKANFDEIGGDPSREWTERQGKAIAELLDTKSPATAPHKAYACFRHTKPDIEQTMVQLEQSQVENIVLLSKYPQYSCNTTGSSLNEIARYCTEVKKHLEERPKQRWSLIDRWPLASALVDAYADLIEAEFAKLPEEVRDKAILLFSAHSVPAWSIERGDDYTGEIGGTVQAIVERLKRKYTYSLVWQTKFGPGQWQGPQLEKAIEGFVNDGHKHFVVVPIALVSESVETLHELDIEYARELKKKIAFETFARVPAANDHPKFIEGLANLIHEHLQARETVSAQMRRRCHGCTKDTCKRTRVWLQRLEEINKQLAD